MKLTTQRRHKVISIVAAVCIGVIGSSQLIAGEGKQSSEPYLVKIVEPVYPELASEQKLEGYVQLQFDVTLAGQVQNINVIKAEPLGVFDQSATEALSRWRYKKSAEGVKGTRVQLDYTLPPGQ